MLRPFLEYCAPVFDPMLTQEQIVLIERQQKRALKIIYGFGQTYEELLQKSGISSLEDRRKETTLNFSRKLAESERFGHLFPKCTYPENMVELRNRKTYQEDFARSARLFNSPLYTMRRLLNED